MVSTVSSEIPFGHNKCQKLSETLCLQLQLLLCAVYYVCILYHQIEMITDVSVVAWFHLAASF